MPDDRLDFTTDYDQGTSTSTDSASATAPEEIKIEPERYGIGKPKRVHIRAKITHDKD